MDFFISYTQSDRVWAEWIVLELEAAGYTTVVQAWDFVPGSDWVHEMHVASQRADRTMPLLSPAYFSSRFGEAEWRPAFAADPSGELGRLVPVRVVDCEPPGLLANRVYVDLVGLREPEATDALLCGVSARGARPAGRRRFPGAGRAASEQARFPGGLPPVFTVPFSSNPLFTGRAQALAEVRIGLAGLGPVHRLVLTGIGGVGKTQLAVEYAYAERDRYEVVWWVRAEEPATLVADYAALADDPQLPDRIDRPSGAGRDEQAAAVRGWLERHNRWLLVLDNVDDPAPLRLLLPRAGGGHVLLTARRDVGWTGLASKVELDVLDPDSAATFLQTRSGDHDERAAHDLAAELGCLPLALEQAAGYLAETGGLDLAGYLTLFRNRSQDLLGRGQPAGREDTVNTTWSLSLDRLAATVPVAVDLLTLAAFLAPDDLPLTLLTDHADQLSGPLAPTATDPLALADTVGALRRHGLVKATGDGLTVHRLLQTVIRNQLDPPSQTGWAATAVRLLAAAYPDHPLRDPAGWPTCARLLPHVLAAADHAQPRDVEPAKLSWLLDRAATYLRTAGQYLPAKPLFERALAIDEAAYGPDHPDVGRDRNNLGRVLRALGDLAGARTQLERALAIAEAAYGPDHPDVGRDRNNLGLVLQNLGDLAGARTQLERALAITEAAYGPDHPNVGITRNNLGRVLQDLGDLAGARTQCERALAIAEAAYGPDHPDVGRDRNNLERALAIAEAALGSDHPRVQDLHSSLERLDEPG